MAVVADGYSAIGVRGAGMLSNDDAGLVGRAVRVCGDRDRAGREFARTVLAVLRQRDLPARQLTLPEGFKDYVGGGLRH
ncbi:hypothetical protein [Kitasatospora sp. NPDC059673]|uniref:hypothetical protein n=1 Tax=Kitasatospora sp. NPDC059673 TaxID=3346901 RepID=UPI0036C13B8F